MCWYFTLFDLLISVFTWQSFFPLCRFHISHSPDLNVHSPWYLDIYQIPIQIYHQTQALPSAFGQSTLSLKLSWILNPWIPLTYYFTHSRQRYLSLSLSHPHGNTHIIVGLPDLLYILYIPQSASLTCFFPKGNRILLPPKLAPSHPIYVLALRIMASKMSTLTVEN